MAVEVQDERLTSAYGTTITALQTNAHMHLHMHMPPLIKTLTRKSGGEVLIRCLITIPPTL